MRTLVVFVGLGFVLVAAFLINAKRDLNDPNKNYYNRW